jgi:hypothetical protein
MGHGRHLARRTASKGAARLQNPFGRKRLHRLRSARQQAASPWQVLEPSSPLASHMPPLSRVWWRSEPSSSCAGITTSGPHRQNSSEIEPRGGVSLRGIFRGKAAMTFRISDRVRYNPDLLPSTPGSRGRTGTIISIEGPHPGQGDRLFARIRMVDDGEIQEGIPTAKLLPA